MARGKQQLLLLVFRSHPSTRWLLAGSPGNLSLPVSRLLSSASSSGSGSSKPQAGEASPPSAGTASEQPRAPPSGSSPSCANNTPNASPGDQGPPSDPSLPQRLKDASSQVMDGARSLAWKLNTFAHSEEVRDASSAISGTLGKARAAVLASIAAARSNSASSALSRIDEHGNSFEPEGGAARLERYSRMLNAFTGYNSRSRGEPSLACMRAWPLAVAWLAFRMCLQSR